MVDRLMDLIPVIVVAAWIAYFVLWKKSERFREIRLARWRKLDELITSRFGTLFFLVGVLCVFLSLFVSNDNVANMASLRRSALEIFAALSSVTIVCLFLGMWRYWVKFDCSGKWSKRASFVLLLLGFWYGSSIYYVLVYLPQFYRRQKLS